MQRNREKERKRQTEREIERKDGEIETYKEENDIGM